MAGRNKKSGRRKNNPKGDKDMEYRKMPVDDLHEAGGLDEKESRAAEFGRERVREYGSKAGHADR